MSYVDPLKLAENIQNMLHSNLKLLSGFISNTTFYLTYAEYWNFVTQQQSFKKIKVSVQNPLIVILWYLCPVRHCSFGHPNRLCRCSGTSSFALCSHADFGSRTAANFSGAAAFLNKHNQAEMLLVNGDGKVLVNARLPNTMSLLPDL